MDDGGLHWDTITDPIKDFFTATFEYLPRIVAALALLVVGWIVAKVVRGAIRKAVRAAKVDERLGKGTSAKEGEQFPVAQRAGTVGYWLVWLFFLLAILETLGVRGMLAPVQTMFEEILTALPDIAAAAVVLFIAFLLGRLLAGWITNFLTSIRFNEVPVKLGLAKQAAEGQWTPARIVGYFAWALIMLFAIMMAADLLNFATVNDLVSDFTAFFARVILAVVILAIGIFLANLVARMIRGTGQPSALATAVQVFVIVLVTAIALRTMGFANDIVVLGFGLMLGAIAVAVALAFGLGGREVARDQLARWAESLSSRKSQGTDRPDE